MRYNTHKTMSRYEYDQILNSAKPIEVGLVEGITVKSDPERTLFGTELEWFCAGLKNTLFNSSDGYNLIPLTEYDIANGLPFRLMDAWSNKNLRKGYLPILPTTYVPITEILMSWAKERTGVTYRIMHNNHVDTLGFIQSEFTSQSPGEMEADINYGNIHRKFLNKGVISTSLGTLITGLQSESSRYGFRLKRIATRVSDRNIGSMKVLARNGFHRDASRQVLPAPVVMGGKSIPVTLDFE